MLLTDILANRAAVNGSDRAYAFLDAHGEEVAELTYAQLHSKALSVAEHLGRHLAPGDRALLVFPPGLDFIGAFFGCLYAGVIAVPINPPRKNRVQEASRTIVADCEPAAVLTVSEIDETTMLLLGCASIPTLTVDQIGNAAPMFEPRMPSREEIAFLQYTSGSTSAPKGVMVTHGNLVANQEMIAHAFGHDANSTVVAWAPHFHDQGLIGNILQPLYLGSTSILMAPLTFIRRPLLWLEAITRYRAHTSGGPNFAFEACLTHAAYGRVPDLDLSSWRVAFNGAEPIHYETLRKFADVFAPYGFDASALYPCYGLAEATLLVTGSQKGRGPRTLVADVDALRDNRLVASTTGQTLTGSGVVVPSQDVAIVDPVTSQRCTDGTLGEVWVSGSHVAQGYWRNPAATEEVFGAELGSRRYLRTGDIGQLVDGELYVAGRLKDLIIIRGRNYYPQDIERTATSANPVLRMAACAALAVPGAVGERLVVVHEVRGNDPTETLVGQIDGAIRAAIMGEHEVSVAEVVLTVPGQLQRTSSGKIMRSAARTQYLNKGFDRWTPSVEPVI